MLEYINESELPYFRKALPDFDKHFVEPVIRNGQQDDHGKTFIDRDCGLVDMAQRDGFKDLKVIGVGCKYNETIRPLIALIAIEDTTKQTKFIVSCCLVNDEGKYMKGESQKTCCTLGTPVCKLQQELPDVNITGKPFLSILEKAEE